MEKITHSKAGAIMICSACGKNGVGTESMYGTAGRLMGNPYQPSLENIVNGANKARFRNFDRSI